jgi:MFS family permease
VVLGGDFVSAIGTGLTQPCLFVYAHLVHHLSYAAAGLVVAAIAFASLAGNPLGGALADRWTPQRAAIVGLLTSAAGSVSIAFAGSAATLFAAACLFGLGASVTWPAQDTLLAGAAGPGGRSAVFSVRHATLNAGLALGALASAAIVSVTHPGSFTLVFFADAATFLAFIPVLARLRVPGDRAGGPVASQSKPRPVPGGYRQVLRDKAFRRVWALLALLVAISFGQFSSTFAGYATRPGGISTHGLSLAYAADMVTVVAMQLLVLRWLAGRRRTTAAALAATAWAASWAVVIAGGHLGGGTAAEAAFVMAMVIFALAETCFSPALSAVINDLAPPEAVGRYNGLGVLAFTAGFLIGPSAGSAVLGARGGGVFLALIVMCLVAAAAALWLGRHLPAGVNLIELPAPAGLEPGPGEAAEHTRAALGS